MLASLTPTSAQALVYPALRGKGHQKKRLRLISFVTYLGKVSFKQWQIPYCLSCQSLRSSVLRKAGLGLLYGCVESDDLRLQ